MNERGDGSPITIGAVAVIVFILLIAGLRDNSSTIPSPVTFSTPGATTSSSSSVAPSVDVTGEVATTTSAAPAVTTPISTGTSVLLRDDILLVDGDTKRMTNFVQPAPCIVHHATDGSPIPDRSCTPGAISTRVTQQNIAFTICVPGYTAKIRPPSSQTGKAKKIVAEAYNVVGVEGEYDHVVPLELGGANDVRNLWLEPGKLPNPKDAIENKLKALVCAGKVTLADAQARIARDWTTALAGLPSK